MAAHGGGHDGADEPRRPVHQHGDRGRPWRRRSGPQSRPGGQRHVVSDSGGGRTVDEIQSGGTVFQIPSAPGPLVAVRSHMDGHLSPSDFGNQQQPFHPSSLYCCSPRRRTELEAARRPTSQSLAAARITSDSDNCDLRELYRYWMLTPPDKVEWHGGAMAGVVPGVLSTAASLPPAMARAFTSMTQ